jgi:hypothetical protein
MATTLNHFAKTLRPKAFGPHPNPAALEAELLAWLTDPTNGEVRVIALDYVAIAGEYSALVLYAK